MDLKTLLTPENIQNFVEMAVAIVGTGIVAWRLFKKKLDVYLEEKSIPVSKKIKKQTSIDVDIMTKLEETKELLNADRVQVYEFHNGGHWANGRSALKTTCTYEVVRYGIERYQKRLENIPLPCLADFMQNLMDNNYVEIKDLDDIKDTMVSTYNFKKDMGITSCYDRLIYNENNEPIGFVAIIYTENKYNVKRIEDKEIVQKLVWFLENKLTSSVN